ncbi:MAG TPA: dihydrolipoamide acetyltransferase family protein [Solirubrobacterales bacterium]|nr:dihydrolipoamide acetyltransferase family protein [Solirubrobacterales bacterium]
MSSSPTDAQLTQIVMPQMGVSVAEGTIVEWSKRPGDWVERDETVCLVTTDKIDVEIPSPAAGRLAAILVEPGDTVDVGTPLAELDAGARPGEAHPEEHHEEPEPGRAEAETGREPASAEDETDRSGFHSPIVRRMADEHDIDLSQVQGTGIGGRIRKRDLVALIESGSVPEKAEAAEEPVEEPPLHSESPYRPEAPAAAPAEAPAQAGDGNGAAPAADVLPGERREPMSPMRRRIAEHMLQSRRTSAHCTTIVEVDLDRVVATRRELKEGMARRDVPLTYLAFVASAAVAELDRHPILNASIEGGELVYHEDVNLGIAVALESGLIVPVIRHAQRLSLEGLAGEIARLAQRARTGKLDPDDVAGGTFTITNPGQFGAVLATPIINQPQVAILDLEAVVKRPVVIDDESEAVAVRPMTNLCMSWDHRALDGAEAARFLSDVKTRLEGWER